MHDDLIKILLDPTKTVRTSLEKGLTNRNYLIEHEGMKYVLRVPFPDASRIVRIEHEAKALEAVLSLDLDVPMVYFDPSTGIKITEYIPDLLTYNECEDTDKIERTALLMRKLHGLNQTIGFPFDPIGRFNEYDSHLKHPIHTLHEIKHDILSEVAKLPVSLTLCHNDWVAGNIGFTQDRDYLIDYEYAGDNDPCFDVMSFLTENSIEDDVQRQRFYQAYFGRQPDAYEQFALNAYEKLHNLLWCAWAMMMYESRALEVYREIADDKYQALLRNLNQK